MTRVSIVITHYHTPDYLRESLESISGALSFSEENPSEVVIVDSDSRGEIDFADKYSQPGLNVRVIEASQNTGYGLAANMGIIGTSGEYVVIANADTIFQRGSLDQLVEIVKNDSTIGLVGPTLTNMSGKVSTSACRFPKWYTPIARRTSFGKTSIGKAELDRFSYREDELNKNPVVDVDWLSGAVLVTPRRILEKVGDFDIRYWMYFEDIDLSRRIHQEGLRVCIARDIKVVHHEGHASRDKSLRAQLSNKMTRQHIKSAVKYFLKFGLSEVKTTKK